jgi:hypothetical protein
MTTDSGLLSSWATPETSWPTADSLPRLHQLCLRLLQLADARGQLVVEAAVLDGKRGGRRQRRQPVQVLGDEAALILPEVGDRQRADDFPAAHQRIGDGRPKQVAALRREHAAHATRPRGVVVDQHALALRRREPQRPLAHLEELPELTHDEPVTRADDQVILAFGPQADQGEVGIEQLRRLAGDQVQPLLEGERHEDLLDDFADAFDMAQPLTRLLVQARVVERQRGLVREGLEQRRLDVRKAPPRPVRDRECPDDPTLDAERHGQKRAEAGAFRPAAHVLRQEDARVVQHVGRHDREPIRHRPSRDAVAGRHDVAVGSVDPAGLPLRDDHQRAVGLDEAEARGACAEDRQNAANDALGDVADVQAARERLGDARDLLSLVLPSRRLTVEPRVLHRQRRLVGEGLQERRVGVRELADSAGGDQ